MQHFETSYTSNDGLKLYSQSWLPGDKPGSEPKAAVCLMHGLGEHSGRYAHVAQALGAAGYALCAYDLRGHGRSGGPRGHSPTVDATLDDVELLLQEASRRCPGRPQFLYGHSLGGTMIVMYALRRRAALQGLVATGPGLRLGTPQPPLKIWLGKVTYNLVPGLTLPNGLLRDGLSRDRHIVEEYNADPLVHGLVSARFGLDLINSGEWALEHAAELRLPLLLMHGGADYITSPQASREFAAKANGRCTLKVWDGLYHEIHNEPEQAEVLKYMIGWLDERLKEAGSRK